MTKIRCIVLTKNGEKINNLAIRNAETNELITYAEKRTIEDYKDEVKNGNNECASLVEKFERVKDGKTAYVWYDCETDETFISY